MLGRERPQFPSRTREDWGGPDVAEEWTSIIGPCGGRFCRPDPVQLQMYVRLSNHLVNTASLVLLHGQSSCVLRLVVEGSQSMYGEADRGIAYSTACAVSRVGYVRTELRESIA